MKTNIQTILLAALSFVLPLGTFAQQGLSHEEMEELERAPIHQAMMTQLKSLIERDVPVKFVDLRKDDPETGQPDIRVRLQDYTRQFKNAPAATSARWDQTIPDGVLLKASRISPQL